VTEESSKEAKLEFDLNGFEGFMVPALISNGFC
jgi:hypothetical protein